MRDWGLLHHASCLELLAASSPRAEKDIQLPDSGRVVILHCPPSSAPFPVSTKFFYTLFLFSKSSARYWSKFGGGLVFGHLTLYWYRYTGRCVRWPSVSAQGPANAAPSARLRGALLEAAAAGAIFGATSFRRVAPPARAVSAVTPPRPSASGICQPSPFCCCCCSNHAHTHAEGDFPEATFPRRERTMASYVLNTRDTK